MTWRNALGFLILGVGMLWLPALAPGLVAARAVDGASTRELWLLLMGSLNAALGGGVLSWQAMMQAWRIPVWLTAEPAPQTRPALRPVLRRPARAGVY